MTTVGTIKSSIQFVANLLKKQGVCNNVDPLKNAFALNSKEKYSGRLRLEFHPQVIPRNTIPSSVKNITIVLDFSICEDFSKIRNNEVFNTIQNGGYNCSILIIGKDEVENNGSCIEYVSSMHLDCDQDVDRCDYTHPQFHLTFGGDKMKRYFEHEPEADFGRTLLLSSPRIAHPPLDIFLAIDFVLCNFFIKDRYEKIRKDSRYKNTIRQSQDRIWKPYYISLAGHWCQYKGCDNSDKDLMCRNFHPSLVANT